MGYGFKVIAEGRYACFTRPEMKVERVSYDVPTPSALEGLIKCCYWKPAIRYVIDKIVVFNPIDFVSIRRNEVKDKVLLSDMKSCMKGVYKDPCIYSSESRSQRSSTILTNVKYGIEFHFELTGLKSEHDDEGEDKHYCILKRRLENGQHFRAPCFGCSEFPVEKLTIVDEFNMNEMSDEVRNSGDVDLNWMLYGMKFEDGGKPVNNDWNNPKFSDKAEAVYYRPHMIGGIIDVAEYAKGVR